MPREPPPDSTRPCVRDRQTEIEYTFVNCKYCSKKLRPIDNARERGRWFCDDWPNRGYHKKCYKEIKEGHPDYLEAVAFFAKETERKIAIKTAKQAAKATLWNEAYREEHEHMESLVKESIANSHVYCGNLYPYVPDISPQRNLVYDGDLEQLEAATDYIRYGKHVPYIPHETDSERKAKLLKKQTEQLELERIQMQQQERVKKQEQAEYLERQEIYKRKEMAQKEKQEIIAKARAQYIFRNCLNKIGEPQRQERYNEKLREIAETGIVVYH